MPTRLIACVVSIAAPISSEETSTAHMVLVFMFSLICCVFNQ